MNVAGKKVLEKRRIVVEQRRRIVSGLYLRQKLTQRRIQEALAKNPETRNPETGEPWSVGTINSDIKAIKKQWREEASREYSEHVAYVNAEIEELLAKAWQEGDGNLALNALRTKIDLFGLKAPTRHEVSGIDGQPIELMAKSDYVEMAQQQMASLSQQFAAIEDADAR
jgi:hypothetical protein